MIRFLAFIVMTNSFCAQLSLEWSTLIGGGGTDILYDLELRPADPIRPWAPTEVFFTGYIHSKEQPLAVYPQPYPTRTADNTLPFQPHFGGEIGDSYVTKVVTKNGSPFIEYSARLGGGRGYSAGHPVMNSGTGGSVHYPYPVNIDGYGQDRGFNLAITQEGDAIVVGGTQSDDFPGVAGRIVSPIGGNNLSSPNPLVTVPSKRKGFFSTHGNYSNALIPQGTTGLYDGFISRLNSAGSSLHFSSYWGFNGSEVITSVTLDSAGNIFFMGYTDSFTSYNAGAPYPIPFQALPKGGIDVFIVKFSPRGDFIAATYLGGSFIDLPGEIKVFKDSSGNEKVYVIGTTESVDFPSGTSRGMGRVFQKKYQGKRELTPVNPQLGIYGDIFISILDTDLTTLEYSTFLSPKGSEDEIGSSLFVTEDTGGVKIIGLGSRSEHHRNAQGQPIQVAPNLQSYLFEFRPHGMGRRDLARETRLGNISFHTLGGNLSLTDSHIFVLGNTSYGLFNLTLNAFTDTLSRAGTCLPFKPMASPSTYDGSTNQGGPDGFLAVYDLNFKRELTTYLGSGTPNVLYAMKTRKKGSKTEVFIGGMTLKESPSQQQDPQTYQPFIKNWNSQFDLHNAGAFMGGKHEGSAYPCSGAANIWLMKFHFQ